MNQPLTFAAARRHRPERAANLLVPGRNCWRIERARKLSWLVDGEQYFSAVRTAMANAHPQKPFGACRIRSSSAARPHRA
jgi:hypothetical protein